MEKEKDAAVMKSYSMAASIRMGYRLFAANFKSLFKASWLFALIFGVVCGIIGPILSIRMPAILTRVESEPANAMRYANEYTLLALVLVVLLVVGGVVEMVFYSRGFALLRTHKERGAMERVGRWLSFDKRMAWRTVKGLLSSAVVEAVVAVVVVALFYAGRKTGFITPGSYTGLAVWLAVSCVLALLVVVPLLFVTMKYVIDERTKYWPLLASDFKCAMRHFGYIFVVMFFVGLVMLLVSYVLQLPTVIISTADYQANLGVVYGDPLGMPSHVVPLTAFVFFVSGFMQAYIRMSALFPLYYMYGSIETQEKEKRQFNEQMVTGDPAQA